MAERRRARGRSGKRVGGKLQRLLDRGGSRRKAGGLWRRGELRRRVGGHRRSRLVREGPRSKVRGDLRSKVRGDLRRCKAQQRNLHTISGKNQSSLIMVGSTNTMGCSE